MQTPIRPVLRREATAEPAYPPLPRDFHIRPTIYDVSDGPVNDNRTAEERSRYFQARLYGIMAVGGMVLLFVFLWMFLIEAHAATRVLPFSLENPAKAAPAVKFEDAEGNAHTLQDFRGQMLVVNIWATWCVPCNAEKPTLDSLQRNLGEKGLTVLALSQDFKGIDAVKEYYEKHNITALAPYSDADNTAMGAFHISALPASFIIDREGNIIAKVVGAIDWTDPAIADFFEGLLKQEPASTNT